ncbi:transcription termination factor MTEF18, mitochondrial-like [Senna tora]|uniref:Transcription termination factor MTEF18, mitochondrial-like n=1 Tax=Senna tora TaxID=362788 RepID=A0A834SIJ9_9FABA|nr:transcription termination factor MTEF18, mitochondrial-like [Senna tora]
MINLRKLRLTSILQRTPSDFTQNLLRSSENPLRLVGLICIAQNPRLCGTTRAVQFVPCKDLEAALNAVGRTIREARKAAKSALLDYLHYTRSFQYLDADNISKNSPYFVDELLKKVKMEEDIKRSVSRYLRYHPINEFEPFFESIGLKPSEYVSFLPNNMIFLSDDQLLLENYYVLCNYGVPRNKIGKIYREAPEVFGYDNRVLLSKLIAYEKQGVCQTTLLKVIVSNPHLLIGDSNLYFIEVIEKLKYYVNDINWIEEHLLDEISYNWGQMLEFLCLLGKAFSEQQLADVIHQHPVLFEESGGRTLSLISFLLKFGLSMNLISQIFLKFPQIQVGIFLSNLRHCFLFLSEIEMEGAEIGKIFRSHALLLGSFTLKRTNSLLASLKVGKKRVKMLVRDNPLELKNWVLRRRVHPLLDTEEEQNSRMQKTKFLLKLGYDEDSPEIKKAFKVIRGKGAELQERFDCIVKAGLDFQDVLHMISVSPQILNLTTDVINLKIDYLVNELGYPVSTLVNFPSFLSYKVERVNLRHSMYDWLVDQGTAVPNLSLSTIVACTEKEFLRVYAIEDLAAYLEPNGFLLFPSTLVDKSSALNLVEGLCYGLWNNRYKCPLHNCEIHFRALRI